MLDLIALGAMISSSLSVPIAKTPLLWHEWKAALDNHPDRMFTEFIVAGIRCGFKIGFVGRPESDPVLPRNRVASPAVKLAISEHIAEEAAAGRLMPAVSSGIPVSHFSPISAIPKKGKPGRWRVITDLSFPQGESVNDGISQALSSLSYASLWDAAAIMARLGRGALLSKLDLQNAYKMIPIHPSDLHLMGIHWEGVQWVDAALPFGLRSAPKLFSAVADALLWVMFEHGVSDGIHYLDDFLFITAPGNSGLAHKTLQSALSCCVQLGVQVAPEKVCNPTTKLTLGIELDSQAMELRLPSDKLTNLRAEVRRWRRKKSGTKRELQSLLGLLNHAASVVGPGRTFMRSLIDSLKGIRRQHHHVYLDRQAKADLLWWEVFSEGWNGISAMPISEAASHSFCSDASGTWGCGAAWCKQWLQLQWPQSWRNINIAVKELVPVVLAVATWGSAWSREKVEVRCDNEAVVHAINAGRARDPTLMRLLRCLFLVTARHDVFLVASHIAGRDNTLADAISRNQLHSFPVSLQMDPSPCQIPSGLSTAILDLQADWTSERWKMMSHSISAKV